MTITEIKEQVLKAGLSKEQVRLYGDLRYVETWEKALESVAICLEISADLEECEGKPLDQQPEVAIPSENGCGEIIPFTHDDNLQVPATRREMMIEEVERHRRIFEGAISCPPPPPPAPIIRTCPIPEKKGIPGIEIAEDDNKSLSTGDGRRDERFKNIVYNTHQRVKRLVGAIYNQPKDFSIRDISLPEQLLDRIKSDVSLYFERFKEDVTYCWENDYFDSNHHQELISLIELMEWNIKNKQTLFDVWATIPYFKKEGFYKLIPFYVQHYFTNGIPSVDYWKCCRDTVFFVIEKPAPIGQSAEEFGGVFIPERFHEMGPDRYLWKFPGMIQAENFFHHVTDAKEYAIIPANQSIQSNQLVLIGG